MESSALPNSPDPKPPEVTKTFITTSPPGSPNRNGDAFHGRLITDSSEVYQKKHGLGKFANSEITELATPWKVTFHTIENEKDALECIYTQHIYFIRAPRSNMGQANVRAVYLWDKWEKLGSGRQFEQYPLVAGKARAELLDEGDWAEAWREAQRYPSFPRNWSDQHDYPPPAFTYFTDMSYIRASFGSDHFDFFRGVHPEENIEV